MLPNQELYDELRKRGIIPRTDTIYQLFATDSIRYRLTGVKKAAFIRRIIFTGKVWNTANRESRYISLESR
mgnify:CR=1 FL=1